MNAVVDGSGCVQVLWISHLELPGRGGHLTLATLWKCQHSQHVALARRQVRYGRLQRVTNVYECVIRHRNILVRLPDTYLVSRQWFLFNARGHVSPGDTDCGRIYTVHLYSCWRLLRPKFEGSLQKSFTLRTRT